MQITGNHQLVVLRVAFPRPPLTPTQISGHLSGLKSVARKKNRNAHPSRPRKQKRGRGVWMQRHGDTDIAAVDAALASPPVARGFFRHRELALQISHAREMRPHIHVPATRKPFVQLVGINRLRRCKNVIVLLTGKPCQHTGLLCR